MNIKEVTVNIDNISTITVYRKDRNYDYVYKKKLVFKLLWFIPIRIYKEGWYDESYYIGNELDEKQLKKENSYLEDGIVYHNPYYIIKMNNGDKFEFKNDSDMDTALPELFTNFPNYLTFEV